MTTVSEPWSQSAGGREQVVREVIEQLQGLDRAVAIDAYRHLVAAHLVGSAGRAGLSSLDSAYPEQGVFQATLTAHGRYAYAFDTASDMLEAEVELNRSLSRESRASLERFLGALVDSGAFPAPSGAAIERARSMGSSGSTTRVERVKSPSGVRTVPGERSVVRRFELEVHVERESHRREGELVDRYREYLRGQGLESSRLEMPVEGVHLYNDIYVHPPRSQLVEAKGDARRQSIRMAIGQIFDYLHQIASDELFTEQPRAGLLLPRHPGASTEALLDSLDIALIWESDSGLFHDNRAGEFT